MHSRFYNIWDRVINGLSLSAAGPGSNSYNSHHHHHQHHDCMLAYFHQDKTLKGHLDYGYEQEGLNDHLDVWISSEKYLLVTVDYQLQSLWQQKREFLISALFLLRPLWNIWNTPGFLSSLTPRENEFKKQSKFCNTNSITMQSKLLFIFVATATYRVANLYLYHWHQIISFQWI